MFDRLQIHAAQIGASVIAARKDLDPKFLGDARYGAALASFAAGLEQLGQLAGELEATAPRPAPTGTAVLGDLVDGELQPMRGVHA